MICVCETACGRRPHRTRRRSTVVVASKASAMLAAAVHGLVRLFGVRTARRMISDSEHDGCDHGNLECT